MTVNPINNILEGSCYYWIPFFRFISSKGDSNYSTRYNNTKLLSSFRRFINHYLNAVASSACCNCSKNKFIFDASLCLFSRSSASAVSSKVCGFHAFNGKTQILSSICADMDIPIEATIQQRLSVKLSIFCDPV